MDSLPSIKKFGQQLDLLKRLLQENNPEQAESLIQTIFENYVFARDGYLRLEDDLIATKNRLSDSDTRLESLENNLKKTLSAYQSDFKIFHRFSNVQSSINALNSLSELGRLLEDIRCELNVFKVSLVLDRELCSGLDIGDIPTFYLKGCLRYIDATLGDNDNNVFIGPISKMMRPDIFFGDPAMGPDIFSQNPEQNTGLEGSCFACGLMDKYHPGQFIGLFSFYDPSPERYHPEMGTDFLEHFCSSLASTLIDVINHEQAELLREDVARITRHDLKTPLNAVINLPHLILATETNQEHIYILKEIQEAGRRMLGVINNSCNMHSMESGHYELNPEEVDLVRIINQVCMDLHGMVDHKKLNFELAINDSPGAKRVLVQGEEILLYSMLANLIKNSFEAAPGSSTVTMEIVDTDGVEIRLNNAGAVPHKIRERFFEKYVTAGKSGGTGLGTYSAKLIADVHGGDITMDTSEANGTTITITLTGIK